MAQLLNTNQTYFLPDVELRAVLKIPPTAVILSVERKHGTLKSRGVGDQSVDLMGCLVTVFEPEVPLPGRRPVSAVARDKEKR